jgi:uncharacterized protein YcnI
MPRTTQLAAAAVAAATALLALTGASALPVPTHIHVDGDAVAGKSATVTFRVANESDSASTVRVEVRLPADTPLTSVRTLSKPGWDVELTRSELDPPVDVGDGVAVSSYFSAITWTAAGDGIRPGEFDEFVATLGAIPDVAELALPTLQVYSDGSEVDWAEIADHGDEHASEGEELAQPAPVLTVAEAGEDGGAADGVALWLGGAGLAAGVLGLAVAAFALVRTRRPSA